MAKHKVYKTASECECEVKKWMERGVYNPESELAWCYFHIFEHRRLIVC